MSSTRYEQIDLIGQSHIGEVWKCLDYQTGDDVAALKLNPQIGAVSGWENVWQEVLQYYRDFRHEYIVPARDTDEVQHQVIMELMRGSMRRVLNQNTTVDAALVRTCLRRSLEALSVVHSAGMLHGDIRPDQLLYRHDGAVRLSFSIGLKPGGVVISRNEYNEYFAPELVDLGAGSIGPATDFYALGITAYEMLVGSEKLGELGPGVGPNTPEPQREWLRWQTSPNKTLPPLREVFSRIPDDLARVVDGLIVKSPFGRFDSATQAMKLLDTSGHADDVIVPIADIPDLPGDSLEDPADKINERNSSGWRNAPAAGANIPAANPVIGGQSQEDVQPTNPAAGGMTSGADAPTPVDKPPVGSGGNYAQPTPQLAPVPLVSSGHDPAVSPPAVSGGYATPTPQTAKAQKKDSQPGTVAIVVIAAILVFLGYGGYEAYRYFFPTDLTEYTVSVFPPDAVVTRGKEKLDVKQGQFTVTAVNGRAPVMIQVEARGYVSDEKIFKYTKQEQLKTEISLQPVVTTFALTVVPASAIVEVSDAPQPPSASSDQGEEETTAPNTDEKDELSQPALYALAVGENPGEYTISLPYRKTVTLRVSNVGFADANRQLTGTGEENADDDIKLVGLTTEYTLKVEPEKATVRLVDPDSELKVDSGKVKHIVKWGETQDVVVTYEGYESETLTLEGTDDEKGTRVVKLSHLPTKYEITVLPPDAMVTLGGEQLDVVDGVAVASVPYGKQLPLEVTKQYYKPYPQRSLEWNDTLHGDPIPVELELDARPLKLLVSPKGVDWAVALNSATGDRAATDDTGTMIPFSTKKIVISADGYRDTSFDVTDSMFEQPFAIQLVSSSFPEGLEPLGSKFDQATGLPLRATAKRFMGENRLEFALLLPTEFDFGVPEGDRQSGELTYQKAALEIPVYVATTETSNDQFQAYLRSVGDSGGQSSWKSAYESINTDGGSHPVRHVSFAQASGFCAWVATGGRLPNEIEWELAARGIGGRTFPWGESRPSAANCVLGPFGSESGEAKTAIVRSLPDGATGDTVIHHLIGNVAEWCGDLYVAGKNDQGAPGVGTNHVIRGASFVESDIERVRATWRANVPADGAADVGFRPVVPITLELGQAKRFQPAPNMIGD